MTKKTIESSGKNYVARKKETIEENKDDFFPTYHPLTRLILDELKLDNTDTFLEPAAGAGDVTKILREYNYTFITEIDKNPRAKHIAKMDFFKIDSVSKYDNIITNPPFKLFMEFFKKSCEIATKNIIMLLPTDYLHGIERFNIIYKKGYKKFRLKTCWVFIRRPFFSAKYKPDGPIPTGAQTFAWYHFEKNYTGDMTIDHLHNENYMGTPEPIDQLTFQDFENE